MNNYIIGKIVEKYPGYVVVENNKMGFLLRISISTYNDIPETDCEMKLYTYISIKNEQIDLYGFSSLKEKMLFTQLIGIPKIGPKTALSVFNTLSPEQFENAILNSDSVLISSVKGISKKTADGIVLELAGKLKIERKGVAVDAYDALIALGFKPSEIDRTLDEVLKSVDINDIEDIIREVLKRLR